MTVTVSLDQVDGAPVVVHRADAADAERLRRTAARLAAAAHPGIVVVVASGPVTEGWELVTAHAGAAVTARSVATPTGLAELGAAVATTLADLHDRGIVHGRLEAARMLLGVHGQPVLCGLGPGDDDALPADDVAALGRVLGELAHDLALEPAVDPAALADLDRLLAAATGPPSQRPPARRLAAELALRAADLRFVARRRGRRPLALRLVALLVGVALGVFVVAAAWTRDGGHQVTIVATTVDPPPPTVAVPPTCAAVRGHAVDAAACGFDASIERGAVVVDGVRSVVGLAGDEVAVADWDCDGTPDPALLRPATGEVLVFGPPDATRTRPVVRATRVGSAVELDVVEGEPGCAALRVRTADGRVIPITGLERPLSS